MADEKKIHELEERRSALYEEIRETNRLIQEERMDGFNFEGKFVHRKECGYMFVTWQKYEAKSQITLREDMFFQGWHFGHFYGAYSDSSYAVYDALHEWHIPMDLFEDEVARGDFREVTRDEVESAWKEMVDGLSGEGMAFLDSAVGNYGKE